MQSSSLYQYNYYEYRYDYDFVFTGAGAAGLSLLMRMLKSGKFSKMTFLLVDHNRKDTNDRTWCFWEKGKGFFEDVVCKQWDKTWFHAPGYSKKFNLSPYSYKMIRGLDFYTYCLDYIKTQENVRILFEPIREIFNLEYCARLALMNGSKYTANYCMFNSIPFEPIPVNEKTQTLLQHFMGWVIETEEDVFSPNENTLMDFRVEQEQGTTFVYIMPLSKRKALVEYTLFSPAVMPAEYYEAGLRKYLQEILKLADYTVLEKEFGVIPMTNYNYPPGEGHIVNIGTVGGNTKPSSGYTFQFIQKNSEALMRAMLYDSKVRLEPKTGLDARFSFYDKVLLDVLHGGELTGAQVFTRLFKRNPARRILKFLDNDSWLAQELLLIGSLPTMPFLRAARRVADAERK